MERSNWAGHSEGLSHTVKQVCTNLFCFVFGFFFYIKIFLYVVFVCPVVCLFRCLFVGWQAFGIDFVVGILDKFSSITKYRFCMVSRCLALF